MSNLLTKYDPPENCVNITVTRVNSEIWQSLNSFRKKADLRLANLQQLFQKATFATLTNVDKLLRITDLSGPTKKELLTSSIDIVALLGHAASEISLLRRELMKPALKPEYHALCSSETKVFCHSLRNTHIRLMIDNTTAVAVINHMGTCHSDVLNTLSKQLWLWCLSRNIWVSAAHIAGKSSQQADLESRQNKTET